VHDQQLILEVFLERRFQLVDVFHDGLFSGNPLAVILDAGGLSTEEMQKITRWMNLSETTFLLPPTMPGAHYKVRIFTLEREMPFAGHPTLGSCHAWLKAGVTPHQEKEIIQECGAGLVPIREMPDGYAFAAPPLIRGGKVELHKLQEVADFLGITVSRIVDAQWADNGPGWVAVLLHSVDEVLALNPRREYPTRFDVGVVAPYPPGSPVTLELRAFFTDHNGKVIEDPVTGSLNASVAQWLLSSQRVSAPYTASQGTRIGRTGRIHIDQDQDGSVWVGGKAKTLFSGMGNF
jgi:PhzF family phenazine biosynthesis protein